MSLTKLEPWIFQRRHSNQCQAFFVCLGVKITSRAKLLCLCLRVSVDAYRITLWQRNDALFMEKAKAFDGQHATAASRAASLQQEPHQHMCVSACVCVSVHKHLHWLFFHTAQQTFCAQPEKEECVSQGFSSSQLSTVSLSLYLVQTVVYFWATHTVMLKMRPQWIKSTQLEIKLIRWKTKTCSSQALRVVDRVLSSKQHMSPCWTAMSELL